MDKKTLEDIERIVAMMDKEAGDYTRRQEWIRILGEIVYKAVKREQRNVEKA